MKYLLSAATLLAASPAFAHGGAHMHPHGIEPWVGLLLASAVGSAAYLMFKARRK